MRLMILAFTLLLAGCAGPQLERTLHDAVFYGLDRNLLIALHAYREGRGQWPLSPDELNRSSFLKEELRLDRYVNLRFEPLPDGRLAIALDRYTSPDGKVTWRHSRIEIGEEARDVVETNNR